MDQKPKTQKTDTKQSMENTPTSEVPASLVDQFANDVYALTLKELKEYLRLGVDEFFHPFPQQGKGSWWHNKWWRWGLAPLLATALGLWVRWLLQREAPSTFVCGLFPISDPEVYELLVLGGTNSLSALTSALLGVWANIGAGRRWRRGAFLSVLFVLLFIYVPDLNDLKRLLVWDLDSLFFMVVFVVAMLFSALIGHFLGRILGEILADIVDIAYPLSKVFPSTFGRPIPEITAQAYVLLKKNLTPDPAMQQEELAYVTSTAQAHLDFSEVMSLPWGIILTIISLGAFLGQISLSPVLSNLMTLIKRAGLISLIMMSILGVCLIAYHAALQVCILQAAAQCRRELLCQRPDDDSGGPIKRQRFHWPWSRRELD